MPDSTVDPYCLRSNTQVADGTLVDRLWKDNCELVEKFLRNTFVLAQARQDVGDPNGTFGSFQYYSVQDYYYLLATIPHKAFIMKTELPVSMIDLRSAITANINSMSGSLEYADQFYRNLTDPEEIDVPEIAVKNGSLRAAGLGYVQWLQGNTDLGWFGHRVSQIPCYYASEIGWSEIAHFLDSLQDTNKSSIFYRNWISPNLDLSYGAKISKQLEAGKNLYVDNQTFPRYSQLFREAMQFEIAFFESAVGKTLSDV
ncbi:hypothetical protein ABKA04_001193 [Annulohypoxylon sp. FPYF3050]